MSNVSIKLLREGAKLPARGSAFAAGYDLYACLDGDKELIIPPHATAMLHNDSNEERTVRHGDRVAQLVLLPFLPMEFEQVDTLPETVRGEGGFGSTGR